MSTASIRKELEQLKKNASFDDDPILRKMHFLEDINKERVSEGKRPVVYIWNNFQNIMIDEIYYEPNISWIDAFRVQEGKFPLLPFYLAGEYQKVKEEIQKYDIHFLHKVPRSTLLKEMCQPLADLCGFEDIDVYHEAERLFMQDQQLYHLHNKPELGEEFRKYLISEWGKEGAILEFDKEREPITRLPAENKQIEHKMIVSDRAREIIKLVDDIAGEYRFVETVKIMNCFEFVDSVAVPGQLITLKYTPTGEYKGIWSAEYSHTGNVLSISNIKLWVWIHQRDINRVVRKIIEGD